MKKIPSRFAKVIPMPRFPLWERLHSQKKALSLDLELTCRCNLNCRHCYINLSAGDKKAQEKELSFNQIKRIVDEAACQGAVWCLLTGGEPLLRKDFFEIYLYLKQKGLLVSLFTNATLITPAHVELFKKYPPRDIEVTVYGVTKETYERVTRCKGSFKAFWRGLNLLLKNGVRVRLKSTVMRANFKELALIREFCNQHTKDYFRFDPFLHLRLDRNPARNREIVAERLTPEEIVQIERDDHKRIHALKKDCDRLIQERFRYPKGNRLFYCGAGSGSFYITYDGYFKLCSSLHHPRFMYDLKKGSIRNAFNKIRPRVLSAVSYKEGFLKKCSVCSIVNLCLWCPAHTYLETKTLDSPVDYFCAVAHARKEAIEKAIIRKK